MNATPTRQYNTVLSQAKKGVPGFALAYGKFIEKVTIGQNSKSLIVNYSRSLAYIALHFSRPPHQVSVEGSGLAILSLFTARFTPLFFLPSQPIFQTDYKALWHYDIKNIKI